MDHDMSAAQPEPNAVQMQQQQSTVTGSQVNPNGFFADTSDAASASVAVAVRIRPLIGRELRMADNICVNAREDQNQIVMGKDRVFTFDKTFGIDSEQVVVFDTCVKNLVLGCFEGFNATILAYGQTGSGKTFTMGSGYTIGVKEEDLGIIPRVIRMIFDEREARQHKAELIVKCTFLEIYNEELHDLLERNTSSGTMIDKIMPQKKEISIREEKNGMIAVHGLKEMTVNSAEEMAGCLDMGSSQRVTACTLMNSSSSRSHGIFTISLEQRMIDDLGGAPNDANKQSSEQETPDEFMTAKFHFVDLAGSERAKSTGATGEQFREGININKGLLALGNVISSLTDPSKQGHVPYRDSKLTRILQDSLGGNSRTVMIAACSPAESSFGETLNSLKYAYRAKSIKNKPVVNRDPASQQIAQLRQMVFELQKELLGSRKLLLSNNIAFEENIALPEEQALEKMGALIQNASKAMGITPIKGLGDGGGGGANPAEVKRLEQQVQELKAQVSSKEKSLKSRNSAYDTLVDQHQQAQITQFELQKDRDFLKYSLEELVKKLKSRNLFEEIVKEINDGHMPAQAEDGSVTIFDAVFGNAGPTVLEEYQRKVEETLKELQESQVQLSQLQTDNQQLIEQARLDTKSLENKEVDLEKERRSASNLTKEVASLKTELRQSKASGGAPAKAPSGFQSSFQNARKGSMGTANPALRKTSTQVSSMSSRIDTSKWLDDDFATAKLKNFDEMRENFIEDLTNQFSDLLVPNYSRDRHNSVRVLPRGGLSVATSEGDGGKAATAGADTEMVEEGEERKSEEHELAAAPGDENASSHEEDSEDSSGLIPDEKPDESSVQVGDETAADMDILEQINNLESEEKHLDEEMQQKELLLLKIKEQQKEMQDALLKEMREEYHKKITVMADEITRLDTEKTKSLQQTSGNAQKGRVEEQFKKKEVELKSKLKELENKQREQTRLTKALNQQKLKTQSMEGEITKMKTQKVTMMKRIKEETENRAKIQKQQAKERADLKRKIAKQQRELDTIKREKNKVDIQARRKHEEVIAMQKRERVTQQKNKNATKIRQQNKQVDTTKIREWIIENTEKMVDYHFLQIEKVKEQKQCAEIDSKIDGEARQQAKLAVECDKLLQRQSRLELLPEGTHDDEIFQTEQEIKETQDHIDGIRETIKSYEEEQRFIQDKITQRSKLLIEVRPNGVDSMVFADVQTLEGARACIGTFFQLLLDSNLQLREQQDEIDALRQHVDAVVSELEEIASQRQQEERQKELELERLHQDFIDKERRLVQLILQKTNVNVDFDVEKDGEEQLDQINLLDLIDLFIKQVKASNDSQYDEHMTQHEKDIAQNSKNEGLKRAVGAKIATREANKEQYNANKAALAKRNAELEKKQLENEIAHKRLQKQLESANIDKAKFKRMVEDEKRKRGQMSIDDPLSIQQQSSTIGHSLKDQRALRKLAKQAGSQRTIQVVPPINIPENLQRGKSAAGDEDMIGENEADDQQIGNGGESQAADVFLRLHRPGRRTRGVSPSDELQQTNSMSMGSGGQMGPQWDMVQDRREAHKSQVYAMTSVGNQLYSAAARSLRIWDISNMTLLSDLTDKIGVIKAIAFWKERNLLLTAAERNIMMWDVVSLTNVGVLKGFKEEIKSLHFVPEKMLLFAASKGTSQSGGLLVYDLRKNYSTPLHEKEKNQDVFSLQSNGSHIFYGCRNHNVYPFCLNSFTTMQELQPPHFDVVTSLALMNGGMTLVSGSRDKNLRAYDLSKSNFPELTSCLNAHNDWINVLETDESQQFLYSGGRDGMVKVWSTNEQSADLQLQASLEGNAQRSSINTICKVDMGGDDGLAFACGSSDKSIRVYRMSGEQAALQHKTAPSAEANVEMADQTQQMSLEQQNAAGEKSFTASQLGQLQELELGLASLSGYAQLPVAAIPAAATEESGAISQLRRRKMQKQQMLQQNNNH